MYPSYDSTAVLAPTASGALASGALASGALASGALASGALASGALASGAAALRRARARAARLSLFSLLSLALAALTLAATFAPAPRGVDHPASSRAASSRAVLALGAPMGEMARAHLDAVAPRPASSGASSNTPSLETVLNADGTIRAGVSGSFDATGFALAYGADGGPRFVPRASAMADGYATINGISGTVRALAVRGSDVYVGGSFTDAGGVAAADYVARWNGTAWSALGGGVNSPVFALAVDGSGEVYVGGQFTSAYSTGATTVTGTSRVARWNASRAATDGGWATLGGGVNGTVFALAVDGSGEVYVGGGFTSALSPSAAQVTGTSRVARWNASRAATDGGWATLGGGVNNNVRALALGVGEPAPAAVSAQAPVPALYLGGEFTAANDGTVASRFTYYTGSGVLPVELVSLTATTSGRTARLSWTTASETNNVGFTVERQTGTAWTDASAMIAGRGTTSERTDYAFNVTGLTAGRHTFRLRQTDLDGTSVVVGTVSVEIGTDGPGAVVTVLGNGSGAPRVRIEGAGVVRAEVYDMLGRRVSVLFDGEVSGTVEASLPVGVSSGAYVVRVVASGRATSHAVVVR